MRFAYADPPYIGQAKKHYGPDAKEVHHGLLLDHLYTYDGWALSCSSTTLFAIGYLIEQRRLIDRTLAKPRIGAWVKPFASFKPNVNPGYCWEPVIFHGGRELGRDVPTVRDYVSANITLEKGVHGAKPAAFSRWLFAMLGMEPSDIMFDLFPGSGAVSREWDRFCYQFTFSAGAPTPQDPT